MKKSYLLLIIGVALAFCFPHLARKRTRLLLLRLRLHSRETFSRCLTHSRLTKISAHTKKSMCSVSRYGISTILQQQLQVMS